MKILFPFFKETTDVVSLKKGNRIFIVEFFLIMVGERVLEDTHRSDPTSVQRPHFLHDVPRITVVYVHVCSKSS